MALSGTINGSVTNKSTYFSFYISWSATQNIAENYSDVTVKTYWKTSNTAHKFDTTAKRNASITINGDTTSISQRFNVGNWESNPYLIQQVTQRIYHNNDGTKSITISARANGTANNSSGRFGPSYSVSSEKDCTASGTITLNTIPRTSSFGTVTGNTIGQNMTVNINRNGDNFTHALWYKLGNSDWYSVGTGIGTSKTFALDSNLTSLLPNSTSGTLKLRMQTYNGTTPIGDYVYKDVTVHIQGTVPTVGRITIEPIGDTILIQGKGKLKISVSGSTPGTGSTIKSYTFSGPGISSAITTTSTSVETGIVTTSGTLTYTVKVTDSRGATNTDEQTYNCYAYSIPTFTQFESYRCDADETANNKGACIKCTYTVKYSYVNNTNDIETFTIYGGTNSIRYSSWTKSNTTTGLNGVVTASGSALISGCSTSGTYNIYAIVKDKYGGQVTSGATKEFGESRVMNVKSDGNAVAFGRLLNYDASALNNAKKTENNVFVSKWPIKTDDPITTMNNLTVRGSKNNINDAVGSDKGNLSTTFVSQSTENPGYMGYVLNVCGYSNNNMQLWLPVVPTDSMYFRIPGRVGSDVWKEVIDNTNLSNYLSDYVVEQDIKTLDTSTDNSITYPAVTWTYRKWNSGFVECFAKFSVSSLSVSSTDSWGGALYTYKIILPKLPFAFQEKPNITTSWQSNESKDQADDACIALILGIKDCSTTTCGTIYLARPDTVTIHGDIIITAIGKWK